RTAGAAVDSVVLIFRSETGSEFVQPLCTPPDPIEGLPGCPAPPHLFTRTLSMNEGSWTVVARVTHGITAEVTGAVPFKVLQPDMPPAGPVILSEVSPNDGFPFTRLRLASPGADQLTIESEVEIFGQNLDNNPFLRVYLTPKPTPEPEFPVGSALPVTDWCLFAARIISTETVGGGNSKIKVAVPAVPAEVGTRCGVPAGSIFAKDWRWVVEDPWQRPERIHRWWAIPSPRIGPAHDAPPFKVTDPLYPRVHGFGFENTAWDPTYNEFLTVFGNSAYLCVDCLPLVGCACVLPKIIDPLFQLWWPAYWAWVKSSEKSCNGMASTSLLMAREELQPQDFDANVLFPAGFTDPGLPAVYEDTNFCTPYC